MAADSILWAQRQGLSLEESTGRGTVRGAQDLARVSCQEKCLHVPTQAWLALQLGLLRQCSFLSSVGTCPLSWLVVTLRAWPTLGWLRANAPPPQEGGCALIESRDWPGRDCKGQRARTTPRPAPGWHPERAPGSHALTHCPALWMRPLCAPQKQPSAVSVSALRLCHIVAGLRVSFSVKPLFI